MIQFAHKLINLKEKNGGNLELATCSEGIELALYGIKHNSCIDASQTAKIAFKDNVLMNHLGIKIQEATSNLFGEVDFPENAIIINETTIAILPNKNKGKGQRKLCGCIPSKDIDRYDTCLQQCVYCYANASNQMDNYKNYNPISETL